MGNEQITNTQSSAPQASNSNLPAAYSRLEFLPITWRIVGAAVSGVAVLGAAAYFLPDMKERMKFFTDGALSWLVFVIVAVQAYIYSKMAGQNERLIEASEDNAEVAREAFHVGSAPYFGIPSVTLDDLATNYWPQAKIFFLNGGRTPAWRIHTRVRLGFGDTPDESESWNLRIRSPQMVHTFLPAGQSQQFDYAQNAFCYTHERETMIKAGTKFLFVIAEIHYRDFRKRWHSQVFRTVWQPQAGHFHDYDASGRDCPTCRKKGYSQD